MTVGELIKELSEYDEELQVYAVSDDLEDYINISATADNTDCVVIY
jgi:hypothetical protein